MILKAEPLPELLYEQGKPENKEAMNAENASWLHCLSSLSASSYDSIIDSAY